MKYYKIIASILIIITANAGCTTLKNNFEHEEYHLEPFAISFGQVKKLSEIAASYNLLIVESDHFSKAETDSLNTSSNKVIAYVSLGEVNKHRWYYPLLEERGFLGINENWDSSYINLADPKSREILLEQVIPNIMIKGYDGLFLDTVDAVAPYTERAHLEPYMVEIIRAIRHRYPDAFIVQNAGLFLLDKVDSAIDAVLVEDVATSYNFDNRSYNLRDQQAYEEKLSKINRLNNKYHKPFLLVEYAESKDLIKKVVDRLERLPYPYFISTIELNSFSKGISSQ